MEDFRCIKMAELVLDETEVIDYRTETLALADDEWTRHIISVSIDDDYDGDIDASDVSVEKLDDGGVKLSGAEKDALNYIVMAALSNDDFWKSDTVSETTVHNTLRNWGDKVCESVTTVEMT